MYAVIISPPSERVVTSEAQLVGWSQSRPFFFDLALHPESEKSKLDIDHRHKTMHKASKNNGKPL
jgi:hypothetical protein